MIKKTFISVLTMGSLAVSLAASPIISVPNTDKNQVILDTLDLDYSCIGSTPESLNFHLDERAEKILDKHSQHKKAIFSGSRLAVEDVEAQFEALANESDLGVYHTFEEMESELQNAVIQYPDLTELSVAGTTAESRPIYVLEITNKKSNQSKVNFLVTGTHHAREWISTEVPMAAIADFLTKYGTDAEVTQLLDSSRIVVVPMLNPDGAVFSRTQKRMWRKNRRKTRWGTGVDNNRNYGYKWGGKGASSSAWSDTFRGPNAMSEVENNVIKELQENYGFSAAISFHSYSELILWPWGYTASMQTRDHAFFAKHGKKMGEIMGNYRPMQASGLYEASGIFDDYLYAEHNVVAYTIELGRQFIPAQSEVPEINSRGVKMLKYVFNNIRNGLSPDQKDSDIYRLAGKIQNLVKAMMVGEDQRDIREASLGIQNISDSQLNEAFELLHMKPDLRSKILSILTKVQNFK